MKILYVTVAWTGLIDILFNGSTEARGMPAFIKPLQELIRRGYEVDLFLIHNYKKYPNYNINIDWLSEKQIIGQIYWDSNLFKKPFNSFRLLTEIRKVLRTKKYGFVYGHGSAAEPARRAAVELNIPFGQRLYGTFLYDYISKNNKIKASILHYLEYNAFKSPKSFLLVTNDGSNGDKAYELINKNKNNFDFYFWHNGIDIFENMPEDELMRKYKDLGAKKFLFYVARIDRWKRQDEAIRITKKLIERGYDIKLFIAGQVKNKVYYDELINLINELELTNNVEFMGAINRETINIMSKLAIASFSLYDMCNLGNIFYEMLSAGAVIISKNDGSLDAFITHGENGFLINNLDEACDCIVKVMENEDYEKRIREKAIKASNEKMKSWKQRVDDEIKLIDKYSKI